MFFILLFFILLTVIVLNSKLQVKIYNLDISTDRTEKVKKDFKIYLEIIIFNKIKILRINIKNIKSKKINLDTIIEKAKKFEEKSDKQISFKNVLKGLKNLNIEIRQANLYVELGTKDAALTAISVGAIAGILGTVLKKQKFIVLPIYQDKNILNIKLSCIFRIDFIHYIYKTILKGRDKNERKPSNRRTYAYSNE